MRQRGGNGIGLAESGRKGGIKVETEGYRAETIELLSEAREETMKYPYALLYRMSEVILAKGISEADRNLLDDGELLEARFFGDAGELHLFPGENGLKAVRISETDQAKDYLDIEYTLAGNYADFGNKAKLCERRYLSYDEDGQAVVSLCRLLRVKGGVNDGK